MLVSLPWSGCLGTVVPTPCFPPLPTDTVVDVDIDVDVAGLALAPAPELIDEDMGWPRGTTKRLDSSSVMVRTCRSTSYRAFRLGILPLVRDQLSGYAAVSRPVHDLVPHPINNLLSKQSILSTPTFLPSSRFTKCVLKLIAFPHVCGDPSFPLMSQVHPHGALSRTVIAPHLAVANLLCRQQHHFWS